MITSGVLLMGGPGEASAGKSVSNNSLQFNSWLEEGVWRAG